LQRAPAIGAAKIAAAFEAKLGMIVKVKPHTTAIKKKSGL
jgi:hypothetical protein